MGSAILPATTHPRPDEILSSWLTRLAHRHAMKCHSFCKALFPGQSIWNRDIDKLAPEAILVELSHRTLTSIDTIRQTTLSSYEGRLYLLVMAR
ncbi:TniQ family protein [Spirosoma foliorum]|uniref:TniQ family protein n=1 Tax=Spirosoma foliorum TaxID=2710596 RepID=A0A7G5GWS2_9BACT|nr:TniQ family protein [Spirosoma foliorum]